jgi:hypothetical protein
LGEGHAWFLGQRISVPQSRVTMLLAR